MCPIISSSNHYHLLNIVVQYQAGQAGHSRSIDAVNAIPVDEQTLRFTVVNSLSLCQLRIGFSIMQYGFQG